ncbi:M23 family metallopeptidase, partial [Patescibacteria group bacterium]|nr:M23 family metallopeptidase [Patescibacteria group bacterium]
MRPISKKPLWALGLVILALFIFIPVSAQENQPYGPPTWPYKIYPGSKAFNAPASWDYQGKHTGIDLYGPAGTPIYSSCTGIVVFWGNWQGNNGWINTIWVDCQDGNFFGYTHLDNLQPHSSTGDQVSIGQQIAVTGPIERSGIGSDDHLHWMRSKTDPRNGLSWFFTNPTEGVNLSRNPSQANTNPSGQLEVQAEQSDQEFNFTVDTPQKPNFIGAATTATITQPNNPIISWF